MLHTQQMDCIAQLLLRVVPHDNQNRGCLGDCLVTQPHELIISVCSFFFEAALVIEAQKENLVPWYERTDFDLPSEEEEDEKERLVKGRRKGSKKIPKKENPDHNECGFTYPLDVWCLLAQ